MQDTPTPTPLPVADLAGLFSAPDPPPFALVRRHPHDGSAGDPFDVYIGTMHTVRRVTDLPSGPPRPGGGPHALAVVPYRCLAVRGLDCRDDGTPVRVLRIRRWHTADTAALTAALAAVRPAGDLRWEEAGFDDTDEEYAGRVRDLLAHKVARTGLHVLIRRDFTARLPGHGAAAVGELFRRLSAAEHGAHWTFAVHTGGPRGAALAGASPQGHVSVERGRVVMHPMCGTLRLPPGGLPAAEDLAAFLRDRKETEELGAVVDAELALLCRVTTGDVRLEGPGLRPLARVLHTECRICGTAALDVRHTLAGTLFAATAVGRPFAEACSVIARREPSGRGYYGGSIALLGHDASGGEQVDTAVLIRTFELSGRGTVKLSVGATVGPRSVPADEAAETRAKASALLSVFDSTAATAPGDTAAGRRRADPGPGDPVPHEAPAGRDTPAAAQGDGAPGGRTPGHRRTGPRSTVVPVDPAAWPSVSAELDRRRALLSAHWRGRSRPGGRPAPGGPVLLVDAGGEETAALAVMLRGLGRTVEVCSAEHVAHATGVRPGDPAAPDARVRSADLAVPAVRVRPRDAVTRATGLRSADHGMHGAGTRSADPVARTTGTRSAGPTADGGAHRAVDPLAPGTTVVVGPGPGDPFAIGDDRIAVLRALVVGLMSRGTRTVGVGLGFHLLLAELGLAGSVRPRGEAAAQQEIDVLGRRATVGYGGAYAVLAGPHTDALARRLGLTLWYGPGDGELAALRGPRTGGCAFLPASVLSVEGAELLTLLLE
ncbi:chorismate-binding protein [Streptomyces phaeoluteigriseus]|uniref:anthranilate synthase n=1 Tax=Streptomyces phaeoluteigriseus TaxID=114686 RepID=A0ABY4ZAY1_9ACTN|nr:chorismate-binding protein [Streptomyces phaeoluteigriseus]USQ86042.1 chorismate-binding protein [Streptomyces phaeoluteigriseus]